MCCKEGIWKSTFPCVRSADQGRFAEIPMSGTSETLSEKLVLVTGGEGEWSMEKIKIKGQSSSKRANQ